MLKLKFRGSIRKIEHVGNDNLYLSNKLLTTQNYADEDYDHSVLCNIFKKLSTNNIIKQASIESML